MVVPFRSSPRCPRGFTLVELLVVVAVLSILAALLYPALTSARRMAWGAGCTSNLRQIGTAIQLYAQDWEDLYPYGIDFADEEIIDSWKYQPFIPDAYDQVAALAKHKRVLPNVLVGYLKSPEMWRCPADSGMNFSTVQTVMGGGDTGPESVYDTYGMSYAYRTELALLQKPIASLREPSRVNVLMDAAGYWHTRFARNARRDDDSVDYVKWGYNVLFGDGSVRSITSGGYFEAWGRKLSDRDPFDLHPEMEMQ